MYIKKACRLCKRELIQTLSDVRVYVIFVVGMLLSVYRIGVLIESAKQANLPINVLEAYLNSGNLRAGNMVLVCLCAVLFCDEPFKNHDTLYTIYRTGRMPWMLGKIASMVALTCLMQLLIFIACTLYALPYSFVGKQYSTVFYDMVMSQKISIKPQMLYALPVVWATFFHFLLSLQISISVALVLFAVNLRFKRIYGLVLVGVLVLLELVRAVFDVPTFISPVGLSMLHTYQYGVKAQFLNHPIHGVLVLLVFDLFLLYMVYIQIKRKGFSLNE